MKNKSSLLKKLYHFKNEGIIGDISKATIFNDEPKFPQWFCNPHPNRKEILEEQYGSSLSLDDISAKIKCIAEAVERYCSEQIDKNKIINSSANRLKLPHISLEKIINYDESLLNNKREIYLQRIKDISINWVSSKDIEDNTILIPAQLIYSPYDISNEPLLRTPISTGAAFGINFQDAFSRGILEVIERDAFMLFWLGKRQVNQINLELHNKLNDIKKYFERYLLDIKVYDISSDIRVPTMLGVILDYTGIGPAVSFGLKCDYNPTQAIIGSILEAQHVRGWIRFSYNIDGKPKINNPQEIKDLKTRGYYWYNKSSLDKLNWLINTPDMPYSCFSENYIKNYDELIEHLIQKNIKIFYADISTQDVIDKNFKVIKAIIPQLHPLTLDEDAPYNYGPRIEQFNIKIINKKPHPFL